MSNDMESITQPGANIKVIGVGGGGGNAINTMIESTLEGVDFVVANTDIQALTSSDADVKIQIGKELTRGLGAGADPDVGREAAVEDRHELQEAISGADMVFITAGMGGGTGTGAAAIISQIAKEKGALTVGVVTKPFGFEGKRRARNAEAGIAKLRECVDTLITIPNQKLIELADPSLSMVDAFKLVDEVLVGAVQGISDIINIHGVVNVDFADVKAVMSCMGQALMGTGIASGENRAAKAAELAISSPLLDDIDIEGATGILINISAGSNVTLMEVNQACSIIQDAAHEEANIIFGSVIDETLEENLRVTVIATGFPIEDERSDKIDTIRTNNQRLTFAQEKSAPIIPAVEPSFEPIEEAPQVYTKQPEVTSYDENQVIHTQQTPIVEQTFTAHAKDEIKIEAENSSLRTATEIANTELKANRIEGASINSEAMLNNRDNITQEIDKKIDDSISLAQRLQQSRPSGPIVDNRVEIPAFLRNDELKANDDISLD